MINVKDRRLISTTLWSSLQRESFNILVGVSDSSWFLEPKRGAVDLRPLDPRRTVVLIKKRDFTDED